MVMGPLSAFRQRYVPKASGALEWRVKRGETAHRPAMQVAAPGYPTNRLATTKRGRGKNYLYPVHGSWWLVLLTFPLYRPGWRHFKTDRVRARCAQYVSRLSQKLPPSTATCVARRRPFVRTSAVTPG